MSEEWASRRSELSCAARAVVHGRTVERFADPTAMVLLPPELREMVELLRAGAPRPAGPAGLAYEIVAASTAITVPAVVAIDDAIRAAGNDQLVFLGAGLDGSAWRLAELAETVVFEVDYAAAQAVKRLRVAGLPRLAREVRFVPLDGGADDLAVRLKEAGHDEQRPTTWVGGLRLTYPAGRDRDGTLRVIDARSAPGSTLVMSYSTPRPWQGLGWLQARLIGARDATAAYREQRHSFYRPVTFAALLARHGFTVQTDRDMVDIGRPLGADVAGMGPYARTYRLAVAGKLTS